MQIESAAKILKQIELRSRHTILYSNQAEIQIVSAYPEMQCCNYLPVSLCAVTFRSNIHCMV